MENVELNEFQTPLSELNLDKQPDEVKEQFLDFFYNVPFILNLTSKDRKRAKDLPRDDKGRIIIDITHPHILEDMDYFRPAAIYYLQHGCYTKLRPNDNPNSEFGKWITEEVRRCREGYVRESDGEWITGDYYFFLNYAPMQLVKKEDKNSKKGRRVFDFPNVWEGHYLKSHALNLAREQGHHYAELSSRGRGKSFYAAAMLAKRFVLGESKEVNKKVVSYITADDKKYLVGGDQTLDKFQFDIDWASNNMEWPSKRLINSLSNMQWIMGYKDMDSGTNKGTLNSVIGVTSKDDPQKLRGTRGVLYVIEEMGTFPALLDLIGNLRPSVEDGEDVFGTIVAYGCVCAGTIVYDKYLNPIKIEDVKKDTTLIGYDGNSYTKEHISWKQPDAYKECIRIKTEKNNILECSIDHPILALNKNKFNHTLKTCSFYTANELKIGDTLIMPRKLGEFGTINEPNAFLLGALFGDGNYSTNSCVSLSITTEEEYEYYNNRYDVGISKFSKGDNLYAQIYFRSMHPLLAKYKMDRKGKNEKCLPFNIFNWNKQSVCDFLGGYFTADGSVEIVKNKHRCIKLTCKYEEPLQQVKTLLLKLGITAHIYQEDKKPSILRSKVNNQISEMKNSFCYVLYICNSKDICIFRNNIKFLIKAKQDRLDSYIPTKKGKGVSNNLKFVLRDNKKGELLKDKVFNDVQLVTIKSIENIGILKIYNMTADTTHTYISNGFISSNTAGDKESDFSSAQEIVYNPEGYNFIAFDNVYDKIGLGKRKFAFFFPGYINMANCYDSNGNSDVTKALLSILKDRYFVKYHSTNINAISKRIAEIPVTPQEAMLKSRGNIFPVTQLTLRLNEMDNNPTFHDSTYVGELVQNSKGEIIFQPTKDEPIREYPIKNNKEVGAIEIWKMPEKDSYGKVMQNRYIIGHDPVDLDAADTASLTSTFVLDTFTDLIVAEYTGRQPFADDNFEIVRKLCLFYNAKCLYEAHPYSLVVYTPDGKKLWKDIKIGDKLFSPTKGIVTVTNIPIDEKMPIYNITLSDGRTVLASDNHIWLVYKGTSKTPIELTTKLMLDIGVKNKHNQHTFFIPQNNGVEYSTKQLPIDPYTMGLILAEGSIVGGHCFKNGLQISSSFEDMLFYKQNIPYEIKYIGTKGFSWHLYIDNCKDILNKYNLYSTNSHTKFIPDDYLFNDKIQRMELLKGLMDGDGCASTDGAAIFTTCSNKLAQNIMLLVRSLGIKCWLLIPRPNVYRVAIASTDKIFKLPRKIEKQHIYLPYKKGSKASAILNKTAIVNIEYSHDEMGKCVTVNSEDGLYLIGDYITTHNCNKKGMFAYFQKFNCLWLLKDTPQYLKDVDIVRTIGYGNNAKGVNATLPVNNYANERIRDWLLKPVTSINPDTGEETTVPNLAFIRSRALLKELIAFNPDINVDRVRALGMVMLYREEMLINGRGTIDKKERKPKIEDEYFSKNYDLKFGKSN